ncbi:MAG: HYR domain-containing protein, partial [Phaeodactylibacter sp.]|nr:HYR domain-containing protein [Phaeodactylibacter sp.]
MKTSLTYLFFLLFSIPAISQPWTKIIGNDQANVSRRMRVLDNHIYFSCNTHPVLTATISKWNMEGEHLWTLNVEEFGLEIMDFQLSPEGDVLLVGYSFEANPVERFSLIGKIDATGSLLWLKKVDFEEALPDEFFHLVFAPALYPDDNCDFYALGRTRIPPIISGEPAYNFTLIGFDSDGTVCWSKGYEVFDHENKTPEDLVLSPQGTLVLAANGKDHDDFAFSYPGYFEVDGLGVVQGNFNLYIGNANINAIVPLLNGERLLLGETLTSGFNLSPKTYLAKVDANGSFIWKYQLDWQLSAERLVQNPLNPNEFFFLSDPAYEGAETWTIFRLTDLGSSAVLQDGRYFYLPGQTEVSGNILRKTDGLDFNETGELVFFNAYKSFTSGFGSYDLLLAKATPGQLRSTVCTVSPYFATLGSTLWGFDAVRTVDTESLTPVVSTLSVTTTTTPFSSVEACETGCDARFTATSDCGTVYFELMNPPASDAIFYWDFGDGANANTESAVHTYTDVDSVYVRLTLTEPGGCKDIYYLEIFPMDGDLTPPEIECPDGFSVPVPPGVGAIVYYDDPVTTDNCAIKRVACLPETGSVFLPGMQTVNCEVKDEVGGNTDDCTFTIDIVETDFVNCPYPDNQVIDAGFSTAALHTWRIGAGAPLYAPIQGCMDPGYFRMKATNPAQQQIYQQNIHIQRDSAYILHFCGRFLSSQGTSDYIRYRFYASKEPITDFNCFDPMCGLIGESPAISDNSWQSFELPEWVATRNYSILTIVPVLNSDAPPADLSAGEIDNVCLMKQEGGAMFQVPNPSKAEAWASPNPFHSSLEIHIPDYLEIGLVELTLHNLNGQSMPVEFSESGHQRWTCDLSNQPTGVYWVTIREPGTDWMHTLR